MCAHEVDKSASKCVATMGKRANSVDSRTTMNKHAWSKKKLKKNKKRGKNVCIHANV